MQNHLLEVESRRAAGPTWDTVRYMIAQIQYGGRITDDFDNLLMRTYAAKYFHQGVLAPSYTLYRAEKGPMCYQVPQATEIEMYRKVRALGLGSYSACWTYGHMPPLAEIMVMMACMNKAMHASREPPLSWHGVLGDIGTHYHDGRTEPVGRANAGTSTAVLLASAQPVPPDWGSQAEPHVGLQAIEDLPGEESPEVFGLHANADLTFRTLQARDRLQLFRDTRPAQMSRKAGASREDVVDKLAEDLLVKVRVQGFGFRL